MNKETFNKLIAQPGKIKSSHKNDFKNLAKQFPYCQSLQLGYLTSLYEAEDLLFETELKKTAAKISDRNILRSLFVAPVKREEYLIQEEQVEEEFTLQIVSDTVKENAEKASLIEETVQQETPSIEAQGLVETTEKLDAQKPVEEETSIEELQKDKQEATEETTKLAPELDELIISEAVSASISIEVAEEIPFETVEIEDATPEPPSKLSFSGWLDQIEGKVPEIKETEENAFRKKAAKLVDQFIASQPKIVPKKDFFSPENMAKKSLEESNEIVSETLAKIYADQGNTKKAISIYNKLRLKFPEKKAYFASLVKELENSL